MNNIESFVEETQKHKTEICNKIIYRLEHDFGPNLFKHDVCKRDLCLIITAIQNDLLTDTSITTIKTGLAYIHAYNAIKFVAQKSMILTAIELLKEELSFYTDDNDIKALIEQRLEILYGIVNEKAIQEVRVWSTAGKVLPYIALSGLIWAHFMGHDTMYELVAVTIATVFFTVSVTWWWWAIYKITTIITIMKNTHPRFRDISERISNIRADVSEIHKTVLVRKVDKSKQ